MHNYRKVLLLAALALCGVAATASVATANNLSTSEQALEVIWNNSLGGGRGPLSFIAAGNTVTCNVTLLGRLDTRTIRKLAVRVGYIRHVDIQTAGSPTGNCTGGTTTALTETLPWNVNYRSFSGILPDITLLTFSLSGSRFRITPTGQPTCRAGTTATEPGIGNLTLERGRGLGLRADESARIRLGGGFICELAGSSAFAGTALLRNLPNNADLTITLI